MTTANAHPAIVTISTTPLVASGGLGPGTRLRGRSRNASPFVGLVARVVAGLVGVLLGVAIGLVSAGFDTTRLLLALGAIALGIGWVVAFVSDRTGTPPSHR